LENTSHRRDRCRHGNQHLRLRRPVIFAASQPYHSQGPSPSRPSSWEPPPVAASRSGTRTPKRVAGRVPAPLDRIRSALGAIMFFRTAGVPPAHDHERAGRPRSK
jgi:hypothetical protein